jgi:hypothetical protein
MATYLQGVTDYIPQFQPFQPDLNFYSNILQTKQSQYDTNWKALNTMYSQYYNADLTRTENVDKKDQYIKGIDFNLKRVSQLDLSLEQNVDQATQVFKPFYEDKGLMKDMAWTKNYNAAVGRAESLKTAYDDKQRGQYWATGVTELNYLKDEFKNTTSDKAMTFGNVSYTPYVNVSEKAQAIAKEFGNMETPSFSKDGKFILKTKNGEQLIEPLSKLFESRLGDDPAIQALYKTQAYVNRKDYSYSNAAQFNGDKNAAEMKYLETSFNLLKEKSTARYNALKENSQGYNDKIANLQKQVDDKTASPEVQKQLADLKMNKEINDKVLTRAEEEQKTLNGGQSSTATTTTGFVNPYGDVESLRWKVDNGMASTLMQKDLNESAQLFAYSNYKQDIEANPYAVLEEKNRFSMQQIAARNAGLERAVKLKVAGDAKNTLNAARIAAGTHYLDEETGQVVPYEAFQNIISENSDQAHTDKLNLKETSKRINEIQAQTTGIPYLKNTVGLIQKLVKEHSMTQQEASAILGYDKNPNISLDGFSKKLDKYGVNWMRNEVGAKNLHQIEKEMTTWLGRNSEQSGLNSEQYQAYRKSAIRFDDYTKYLKEDHEWRKTTSFEVERDLRKQGLHGADYLYDNGGNLRTREEFIDVMEKKGKIGSQESKHEIIVSKIDKLANEKHDLLKDRYNNGKNFKNAIEAQQALHKANDPELKAFDQEIIKLRHQLPENLRSGYEMGKIKGNLYDNYEKLVSAASKVYTSGRIKKPLPGMAQFGEMEGTGTFAPRVNTILVNPKGHGPTSVFAGEVFRDLDNNIDWGDNTKNRASFRGFNKGSWDNHSNGDLNSTFRQVYEAMRNEQNTAKSKMGNYKITVSPLAAGSINKVAVVIKPDLAWLKTQVYTTDKDGNPNSGGTISAEQYKNIATYGMNLITDAGNMTNSLYTTAYQSPLQSYVDHHEGGYVYTDPLNPNYNLTIQKGAQGGGDYIQTINYQTWNPNTNSYDNQTVVDNSTIFGANLENSRDDFTQWIDNMKMQNKLIANGNY